MIPIPWGGGVPPFLCHVTVKSQVERTRVTSHRPLGPCLNSLHLLFSLGFEANHSRCRRFGKNIAFSVAELARFRDSAGHKKTAMANAEASFIQPAGDKDRVHLN